MAAIVSSIARPPERGGDSASDKAADSDRQPTETTPAAGKPPRKSPQPTTIEFRSGAKPQTRKLELGQPATVLVDVETPGQIDIPSLGLTEPAEPLTPAMFEVLVTRKGSHAIMVQPAASETLPTKIGTLKVVPAS